MPVPATDFDPRALAGDVLLLVTAATGAVPTTQPIEAALPTRIGWLSLAAGPAILLLPAQQDDILIGCGIGSDSDYEMAFLALVTADGAVIPLRQEPGEWSAVLTERAQEFRAAMSAPPIGLYAPTSFAVH
jgi:hypothetical protein